MKKPTLMKKPLPQKKPRGLAALSPTRRREIAAMGGRTAQAMGKGNQFTSAQARSAGKKGGRAISKDKKHMAAIGAKGGSASRGTA